MRWGSGTPTSTAAAEQQQQLEQRGRKAPGRRSPRLCSRASPSRASSGSCASSEISPDLQLMFSMTYMSKLLLHLLGGVRC
uniref:Uncharacterized protein n=1 Tax=Arundo donax TaxID=35708 RepID=A0A0A9EWM4_ARUDO